MAKPYGIDSTPPFRVLFPEALQHFGLAAVTLVVPRIVAEAAGADSLFIERYLSLAMLAVGITTLLQAWGRHGIGSGYLLPACYSGIYLAPALALASQHGLPAIAGFAIVAGITEMTLSVALRRIRSFFPSELIGFVVFMIGIGWGTLGLKLMTGLAGRTPGSAEAALAGLTLAVTLAISLWGPRTLRPLAVLVGLVTGCLATGIAFLAGGEAAVGIPKLVAGGAIWPLVRPDFHSSLLPAFIVGGIASFIRASGDIVASHQVSDVNWKRAHVGRISAGTLAGGLGSIVAGLLGVMPVDTSSGSVGLVAASGVASRRIALGVGLLWIVLGLWPSGSAWLLAIPPGVAGAALCFTGAFVIRTGTNMMTQRLLDNRRALTIGFALMVGLSFEQLLPALHLPPGVRTALDSSLLTAVAVALLLNAVFRIGIRRSMEREWQVSEGPLALRETMDHWGRQWGARADLVRRAQDFLEEFAQAAALISTPGKAASIRATYDEVSLRFDLRWHGSAVAKAGTTPSLDDADESLDHSLAVALMRHRADHLSFDSLGPDTQRAVATLDDH